MNEDVEAEGGTLLSEVPELRLGGVEVGAWAGPVCTWVGSISVPFRWTL